jgi:hypothetical protein
VTAGRSIYTGPGANERSDGIGTTTFRCWGPVGRIIGAWGPRRFLAIRASAFALAPIGAFVPRPVVESLSSAAAKFAGAKGRWAIGSASTHSRAWGTPGRAGTPPLDKLRQLSEFAATQQVVAVTVEPAE